MNTKTKVWWLAPTLLIGATLAQAEEVHMYGQGEIPQAAEVANILGGNKPKMRGISLDPGYKPKNMVKQSIDEITETKTTVVGLPVKFGFNSAEILPQSEAQLAAIADGIKMTNGLSVVVEGHTDAYGSEPYNKNLSLMRAKAVKQYLVDKYGISASQLVIKGLGESSPLKEAAPYAPENRRVQFRAAR